MIKTKQELDKILIEEYNLTTSSYAIQTYLDRSMKEPDGVYKFDRNTKLDRFYEEAKANESLTEPLWKPVAMYMFNCSMMGSWDYMSLENTRPPTIQRWKNVVELCDDYLFYWRKIGRNKETLISDVPSLSTLQSVLRRELRESVCKDYVDIFTRFHQMLYGHNDPVAIYTFDSVFEYEASIYFHSLEESPPDGFKISDAIKYNLSNYQELLDYELKSRTQYWNSGYSDTTHSFNKRILSPLFIGTVYYRKLPKIVRLLRLNTTYDVSVPPKMIRSYFYDDMLMDSIISSGSSTLSSILESYIICKSCEIVSGETLEYTSTFLDVLKYVIHNNYRLVFSKERAILASLPSKIESTNRSNRSNISNRDGPAIIYPDGVELYAIDNIIFPKRVVTDPSSITLQDIDGITNVEAKRILVEKYGTNRFIEDRGMKAVHKDKYGELYQINWSNTRLPEKYVKLRNSTPEVTLTEDGFVPLVDEKGEIVYRYYFLRVPPNITTAHEAVAWTFGLTTATYNPLKET